MKGFCSALGCGAVVGAVMTALTAYVLLAFASDDVLAFVTGIDD